MRRTLLAALAFASLAVPASAAAVWQPYANTEQGVRAEFPGAPSVEREQKPFEGGEGQLDLITASTLVDDQDYYALATTRFPVDGPADTAQLLDMAAEGAVGAVNGTVISSQHSQVNGIETMDVVASAVVEGQALKAYIRIQFKGRVLYQAIVVDTGPSNEADALRFTRSMRLT